MRTTLPCWCQHRKCRQGGAPLLQIFCGGDRCIGEAFHLPTLPFVRSVRHVVANYEQTCVEAAASSYYILLKRWTYVLGVCQTSLSSASLLDWVALPRIPCTLPAGNCDHWNIHSLVLLRVSGEKERWCTRRGASHWRSRTDQSNLFRRTFERSTMDDFKFRTFLAWQVYYLRIPPVSR